MALAGQDSTAGPPTPPSTPPPPPPPPPSTTPVSPTPQPSKMCNGIKLFLFKRLSLALVYSKPRASKITNKMCMKDLGSKKSVEIKGATTVSLFRPRVPFLLVVIGNSESVSAWFQSLSTATGDMVSHGARFVSFHTANSGSDWPSDSVWYNGSTEYARPAGALSIKLTTETSINSKAALYFENVSLDGR